MQNCLICRYLFFWDKQGSVAFNRSKRAYSLKKNLNYFKYYKNKTQPYKIWDTAKGVSRRKFIAIQAFLKKRSLETSLAVQWLRFWAFTTGGTDSIPGQVTKILHVTWHGQKTFKKRKTTNHKMLQYIYLIMIHIQNT